MVLERFLPQRKAEAVIAALSMSAIAEAEHALSACLDNPESVYKANLDLKISNQEVLRVVLLDAKFRFITKVDVFKGSLNERFRFENFFYLYAGISFVFGVYLTWAAFSA